MEPFEVLSLCAEIAIAITGFSGIVLVFSERSRRAAVDADRTLFRMLFTATFVPTGLIAIAFILDAAMFERTQTWRICSSIHVPAVSTALLFKVRAGGLAFFSNVSGSRFVFSGAVLVVGLQLANAIVIHEFWPFLVAVWWSIAASLFAFTSLVSSARSA